MPNMAEFNLRCRAAEELLSLGVSYREIANTLGVTHTMVKNYVDRVCTPGASALAKMHYAGLDVFYILTGQRLLGDIPRNCTTCGHYCDGVEDICDAHNYDCRRCDRSKVCRGCRSESNWYWRGFNHTPEVATSAKN